MKRLRSLDAQTYVLNVALLPICVNLVVSMPAHHPPCCLLIAFFVPPHSRNMPPFWEYQQLGRTRRWERLAELQTAVTEYLSPTWQVQAGEDVRTLILKTKDGPMSQNHMWLAEALLWDCRKKGKSWRALQYSIPTSRIKSTLVEIRRVKDALSALPVVDYNAMDGDHTLLGAGRKLWETLVLMMAVRREICTNTSGYSFVWRVHNYTSGTASILCLECLDQATRLVGGAFYTALKNVLCYDRSQGLAKLMSRCKRP